MREIDPGHVYELNELDGGSGQTLTFVKREGEKYPGNVGSHPGTTTQEVLRALIKRMEYVNYAQVGHERNVRVIKKLQSALYELEARHAELHGLHRELNDVMMGWTTMEDIQTCRSCGHWVCRGHGTRLP